MGKKSNDINKSKNTEQPPLVSIGIPTYNRSALLKRAVATIQAQDYKNIEIIISDNSSPDDTKEVGQKLAAEDSRIQYFEQNAGLNFIYNFDFVLKQSKGKYFMWLADDDWLGKNIISRYVDFFENNSDYSVISGEIVNLKGEEVVLVEPDYTFEQNSPSKRVLASFRSMHYCGMYYGLMRRELIMKIPLKRIMLHDWVCLGGLAALGKVKTLDFPAYYKQKDGMSGEFVVRYANLVGAKKFEANFSRLNLSMIVFSEILWNGKTYGKIGFLKRIVLAFRVAWTIIDRYYVQPVMQSKSKRKGFARNVSRPFKDVIRETSTFKFFKNLKQKMS